MWVVMSEGLDLRALLEAVEGAPPVDAVDVLGVELARMLDATAVSLLITNLSGTAVVRMSHITRNADLRDGRNERVEPISLVGTIHQKVLAAQELEIVHQDGGSWLALVPVTERGDAIGILEISLPHQPDADTIAYVVSAAHALAYVLIASRRHTDLFELAQRDVPFSLAAEMQRRLLPSAYTIEGGPYTLAGWLEPAASVGGDTFDYAVDREYLYLSITDAMGHSENAALLATLTVSSLRNTRRSVASPSEQAAAATLALQQTAGDDQFVTGHIMRLRLHDGFLEIVNAGHPRPYLLRDGSAAEMEIGAGPPLGIGTEAYETHSLVLRPGDRLLLVTDGFLERNATNLRVEDALKASAGKHPRQVVRELAHQVLEATEGNLRDDATALCLDWFGADNERNAIGGASRSRSTQAEGAASSL